MKAKTGTKKNKLNIYLTLVLFAIIPMVVGIAASLIITLSNSSSEIKGLADNGMLALTQTAGEGLNDSIETSEETLKAFTTAPAVKNVLLNPDDAEAVKAAQKYTEEYFSKLTGWEGIYIADWNSKVLTHPVPQVVGRVMREGDALESLHKSMTESETGVYNAGIITSPASGKLIVSMYAPVYDGDKTIGYVGAGTFMIPEVDKYSDVSVLNLPTAYIYVVDKDGIMIYHKDETKIGNPVENEVVKGIVSDIQSGKHPEPKCVSYNYKGAMKHAAYYVGENEYFITVVTADEKDILTEVNKVTMISLIAAAVLVTVFIVVAILIAKLIATPLRVIAKFTDDIASGNLKADIDTKSHIDEIASILESAKTLKVSMTDITGDINSGMKTLDTDMGIIIESVSNCTEAISGVTTAVDGIAKGAMEMAESIQNTAINMGEVGNNIEEIKQLAENTKNSADDVVKISDKAKKNLDELLEANLETVAISGDVVEGINNAGKAIEEISEAANVITEIASQTNLLSLNASIEAARAGEAGRGFAVVAQEIQKLAEQSNSSASEIQTIITNIINKSKNNVELVSKIQESIGNEGKVLREVQNSFNEVTGCIEVTSANIDTILDRSINLDKSKDAVLDEVSTLSSISEENAASCEETTASIQEVNATMESINGKSKDTLDVSVELKDKISYFKI